MFGRVHLYFRVSLEGEELAEKGEGEQRIKKAAMTRERKASKKERSSFLRNEWDDQNGILVRKEEGPATGKYMCGGVSRVWSGKDMVSAN